MANKVTKRDNFNTIMGLLEDMGKTELARVMAHEIELLDKKAGKAKMTKNQEANEGIKELIINELTRLAKPVTITELINASPELKDITNGSNQKVSALMTQLKETHQVVRTQDKKTALFSVAKGDSEDAE